MANLTQKTILLLDKLYNLKGEDNIILQEINSKIEGINNTISATDQRKVSLKGEKEVNENNLLVFTTQQEAFLTAFSDINNDTFGALRNIGVNVEIGSMVSTVAEKAPGYIADLQDKIGRIQTEIDNDEAHKQELLEELKQLGEAKTKAEADRASLVGLMEQSLSTSESERDGFTLRLVRDILSRFDLFDNKEIVVLSKLILFPEDGLIEYDKEYPERLASGKVGEADFISSEETKEEPTTPEEDEEEVEEVTTPPSKAAVVEEPVVEDHGTHEEESVKIYDKRSEEEPTSIIDLTSLNAEPETKEEPKETIEEFLESLGMDMNKFQEENDKENNIERLMNELSVTDHDLIANNYELLKSVNAEIAAYRYRRGHSYLSDKELSQKVTILRAKNISEKNIKLLLEQADSGLRESLETLELRMKAAEELGTPVTDENIEMLGKDTVRLARNIALLNEAEITIDDKERRNFEYILTNSDYTAADLEILKDYLINITRSNDKYALNVFVKDPYDLLTDIDNIIENNLEDVLSTNPEVLAGRNGAFVDRVKYYESIGKPITDTTGKNAFAPYVLNPLAAVKENGGRLIIPSSPSEDEVNPLIPEIIGNENTVSSLVDILNEYYKGRTEFKDIELSDTAAEGFGRLMELFETRFHAEQVGKYTCKVADGYISKPKLERHLKTIVTRLEQNGESIDGIENEILLTSMLYNYRQSEPAIRKMVETCLGFNEENTLGGMAL